MRHLLTPLLAALLLVPAVPASAVERAPDGWTNRLVVTYASAARGSLPAGVRALHAQGRRVVVDLGRAALRSDLARFRDPAIVAVEPDYRATVAAVPSDPDYTLQWDLSDPAPSVNEYSVKAPGAWDLTTGDPSLVVAVIDTGITAHAEFAGRTVAGYDMISDSRIGNDSDGRDADPSDPGDWITSTENASGFFAGCGASNSSWHGSHVAGTIGAAANNATGIAGLNWGSKLQAVRALGKCGGYFSDIADSITWASGGSVAGVPANSTPAKIISLSLGGATSCPSYMQSAIDGARNRGSLVVVAAGNSNTNASGFAPANCSGTIVVAATARDGKRAYYSNYGSIVTIAAPGGDAKKDSMIRSTVNTGTTVPVADGYAAYQGTSMATPHVSGVLSLLLSLKPTLTQSEVLALLKTTSTPFAPDTTTNSCSSGTNCGPGVINATALLRAANGSQASQTISFPALSTRVVGEVPFAPGATASSGLPVSYTVSTGSVCSTDGVLITLRAAGTCSVTANQAGSTDYTAATPVLRSFSVLAAGTVSINSSAVATKSGAVTLAIKYPTIAKTIEVSNSADFATKSTYGLLTSLAWTLPAGDGAKTVYVRFSGGTMVSPATASDEILLDTTAPAGGSPTASGKRATTIIYTVLSDASDATSSVTNLELSLDGRASKYSRTYAASFTYKTSSTKLWIRYTDAAGNVSAWIPVAITLY